MIRRMGTEDIPAAMRLKEAAGWNQTPQDWTNVIALEPEGCWVFEKDGQVVGTTTVICYGQDLAWIGMVLVLPEYRGQGIARRLMEYSLEWIEARNVRQVKLDATDMGLPLYEKLGFRHEQPIERWGAPWTGRAAAGPQSLPAGPIAALDREAFGFDRTRLIKRLIESFPGQGVWNAGGPAFLLGRPGANAYYLGPGVAPDPLTAQHLARTLMAQAAAPAYFWDLFPNRSEALAAARELGFERKRSLVRMALRPEAQPPGRPDRIFGAAGFEYG